MTAARSGRVAPPKIFVACSRMGAFSWFRSNCRRLTLIEVAIDLFLAIASIKREVSFGRANRESIIALRSEGPCSAHSAKILGAAPMSSW
ncbi:MAG: hypothetical protein VXY33_00490, partial [Verrucomicrobiota bacterium]|nr:hypothetical protein [Verrucomicrobiota bacterium]